MRVSVINKPDNSVWGKIVRVVGDPYYYALSLPSFFLLFGAAAIFLGCLGLIMAGIWFGLRTIAHGDSPKFEEVHPKMFIACACVAMMPLVSGVLSRRMTRPEIRGKFVQFSKRMVYKNGHFVFSVIDTRKTQLIGTNIVIELVSTPTSDGEVVCRRVNLGPPGLIAIPTEITVPVGSLFPSLNQVASCDVCGRSDFSSFKSYSAHMSWFHGIARREASEEILKSLQMEIDSLSLLRIVLTGTDEVSGKGGTATKEYKRMDILVNSVVGADDSFSVRTGATDDRSVSSDSSVTEWSAKSSYVHVDFKPNS
jgi:hypothetical protein